MSRCTSDYKGHKPLGWRLCPAEHLLPSALQDASAAVPMESPEPDANAIVPFVDDAADDDNTEQAVVPAVGGTAAGRRGRARTKASETRARKAGVNGEARDGAADDGAKARGKSAKCASPWTFL